MGEGDRPSRLIPLLTIINSFNYFNSLYPYTARSPSSSSMRRSWLYFAIRSERLSEPVLICPLLVATAISAMVASYVSPER